MRNLQEAQGFRFEYDPNCDGMGVNVFFPDGAVIFSDGSGAVVDSNPINGAEAIPPQNKEFKFTTPVNYSLNTRFQICPDGQVQLGDNYSKIIIGDNPAGLAQENAVIGQQTNSLSQIGGQHDGGLNISTPIGGALIAGAVAVVALYSKFIRPIRNTKAELLFDRKTERLYDKRIHD